MRRFARLILAPANIASPRAIKLQDDQETALPNTPQDVRDRAESRFRKMEERASDGVKARTEYEIAARNVDEKTARLKALRLANHAMQKKEQSSVPAKSKVRTKKT